jgi:RNA polymerase sigma factor (sigma-70 family)
MKECPRRFPPAKSLDRLGGARYPYSPLLTSNFVELKGSVPVEPAFSFEDIDVVLDTAIRAVSAKWHFHAADAEDFAQDVRLAVLRRERAALRRFRGDGARTYFYRIANRVAIDRIRRLRRRLHACRDADAADGQQTVSADTCHDSLPHIASEPELAALREHVVSGLQRVLEVLEEDERAILSRRFVSDESADAIARATGGSRRSAARRLTALLAELRHMLVQVGVSRHDALQVLAQSGIDVALLNVPNRTALRSGHRPTRPDTTLEAPHRAS